MTRQARIDGAVERERALILRCRECVEAVVVSAECVVIFKMNSRSTFVPTSGSSAGGMCFGEIAPRRQSGYTRVSRDASMTKHSMTVPTLRVIPIDDRIHSFTRDFNSILAKEALELRPIVELRVKRETVRVEMDVDVGRVVVREDFGN